ncbi:22397_t:CDS:1 [Cetraspora pellucida]|uniref:22397_t:CDS:1 n=1 Tax=Cetraspora pellucida TaxID=1433469 RepID=A0A9N9A6B4_9GLOM|nr:22397_t:CDS:1 [Cetraspora pellucida]
MFDIITFLVILFLFAVYCKKLKAHYLTSQNSFITNADEAHKILIDSDLLSRVIPNQRLKKSFQISNPFTNPSEEYRKKFVKVIHKTIKFDDPKWRNFANIALEVVNNERILKTGFIEIVPWIQKITLSVVLRGYLGFDTNIYDVISDIPKIINDLWLKSKEYNNKESNQQSISLLQKYFYNTTSISQTEDNDTNVIKEISKIAQEHLDHFHESPQTTSGFISTADELKTPLNIVLPAYETMWRVLLYAILEIKVREILLTKNNLKMEKNIYLKNINNSIDTFLKNPSDSTLKNNQLNFIVKETLRLYPATRHIHRTLNGKDNTIDVEAIQRDHTVWGDDALCFKPERFENPNASSSASYIPFSIGKMKCIAADKFAPTVAAILISAILSSVDIVDVIENEAIEKYLKNPHLPFENHRLAFDKMIVNVTTRLN